MFDYDPHFDRLGTHRRVLGAVTDEEHVGLGPRNTSDALAAWLADDPNTDIDPDDIETYLEDLEAHGLITRRPGDTWQVTDAGLHELTN